MKKSKLAKVLTVSLAALMVFGQAAEAAAEKYPTRISQLFPERKAPEQEMRLQS